MGLVPGTSGKLHPGQLAPERLGGQRLHPFARCMLRLVLAGAASAFLVSIAAGAMLFVTAPAWASLIFEPFSLFLLPGLAVGVLASGPHDLDPVVVVKGSVVFYFAVFWAWLEWRAWRAAQSRRRVVEAHRMGLDSSL